METAMTERMFWMTALALSFPAGISAQSIHPFYRDVDVIFKPELLGKWEVEEAVALEFRDLGNQTYGIILYIDKDSGIYFRAHLFCVEKRCFLDGQVVGFKVRDCQCQPAGEGEAQRATQPGEEFQLDKDAFLLNHAHGLILVTFADEGKQVSLSKWEDSWLPKMAELDKLPVAHTKDDLGRVVLTAESDDLRDWVGSLPDEAFDSAKRLEPLKDHESGDRKQGDGTENQSSRAVSETPSLPERWRLRDGQLADVRPVTLWRAIESRK